MQYERILFVMTDKTINTDIQNMYEILGISPKVLDFCEEILKTLKDRFEEFDCKAEYNQLKVINAMHEEKVSDIHFSSSIYSPQKYFQFICRNIVIMKEN